MRCRVRDRVSALRCMFVYVFLSVHSLCMCVCLTWINVWVLLTFFAMHVCFKLHETVQKNRSYPFLVCFSFKKNNVIACVGWLFVCRLLLVLLFLFIYSSLLFVA